MRLSRRPDAATGPSGSSAKPAGGAPGAAYVTDASFLWSLVQGVACVVAENVIEGGLVAEPGPQLGGGAGDADPAPVHQRDAVAVGVGLVHVVGGHQHGHLVVRAQHGDVLPDHAAGDRVEADGRLVEYE